MKMEGSKGGSSGPAVDGDSPSGGGAAYAPAHPPAVHAGALAGRPPAATPAAYARPTAPPEAPAAPSLYSYQLPLSRGAGFPASATGSAAGAPPVAWGLAGPVITSAATSSAAPWASKASTAAAGAPLVGDGAAYSVTGGGDYIGGVGSSYGGVGYAGGGYNSGGLAADAVLPLLGTSYGMYQDLAYADREVCGWIRWQDGRCIVVHLRGMVNGGSALWCICMVGSGQLV